MYFGHATSDAGMNGEQIEKFEWALRSWDGDYESELYDARHGWMIPGARVYDAQNAERGFEKLMELLDASLQSAEAQTDSLPSTMTRSRATGLDSQETLSI